MSRTARANQSSISLAWQEQKSRPCEQKQHSLRANQPTPRRSHEASKASAFDNYYEGEGRRSQPRSHRREEMQKAPPHPPCRHSRQRSVHDDAMGSRSAKLAGTSFSIGRDDKMARPLSARTRESTRPLSARTPEPKSRSVHTQRKIEHSGVCSSPQFGPPHGNIDRRNAGRLEPPSPMRTRFWESENKRELSANRGRHAGKDSQPSRTIPGEELRSPVCNSWMDPALATRICYNDDPLPVFVPLSSASRSNLRQGTALSARQKSSERIETRSHRGNGESSARCYTRSSGNLRSQDGKYNKHCIIPEKNVMNMKSRKGSMFGSSAATSTQASSVIDSYTDLWETSSVDSLPLGAEWFNFMHARN